jgi:thiol-disulfide isomerase/thioredoxin
MTKPGESPAADSSTIAKVAATIALLAAAASAGFIAYRVLGTHASTLTPVQYPGAARSRPAVAESDESAGPGVKKIPEALPPISMPDAKGVSHALAEWKGRPLMVNFWATWCDPCRREIPLLKKLRRERSAESLEIVGIAVDFRDAVIQYTHSIGIDYPVLIGEKDGLAAINAFGMDTVFPFTVFADKDGRIFTVKVGELHEDQADVILNGLRDVDSGKTDIAAARQRISTELARLDSEEARQSSAANASEAPRS